MRISFRLTILDKAIKQLSCKHTHQWPGKKPYNFLFSFSFIPANTFVLRKGMLLLLVSEDNLDSQGRDFTDDFFALTRTMESRRLPLKRPFLNLFDKSVAASLDTA
jgi:hypothetical protein